MSSPDRQVINSSVQKSTYGLRRAILPGVPWIEIVCLTILAGLLVWKGIIPGWRVLNTDFPNYYLVARLLHEGYGLDRIYDWIWLQRIKDHWGLDQTLVGFAGLTPFSALPVLPLSIFSAIAAKRLWLLANVFMLGASAELLNRVTSLGRRRVWVLCMLAIFPLRTSFLFGQMHIPVLVLFVLAYFFHRKGKQVACGVCLSIAGALKVYPLLFGVFFLWKRQWRPALAMLCTVLVLVGLGYLWFGSHVLNLYATQILPRSLQGEVLDPYSVRAASGAALFHRLFIFEPVLNPDPLINSPLLYAVFYPLWQLAIFLPLLAVLRIQDVEGEKEKLAWAAYVFALLVLSPVPSSYHFVVMIFSVVLLVDVLLARKRQGAAAVAVLLYFLISIIEFSPVSADGRFSLVTLLAFARLWLGMLLSAFFLFCLWPDRATWRAMKGDYQRAIALCVVFVAAWTAGFIGYHRHFAYLAEEMCRRIPTPPQTYLATGLHPAPGGYVMTAMLPDGYRVLDQAGREVWQIGGGRSPKRQTGQADQLSIAAAGSTSVLMLEVADSTGSQIVKMPDALPFLKDTTRAPMSIPHAESPAISSDGRSVVFIRELKGKGTLWLAPLQRPPGTEGSAPVQLVGNAYDIRDATFAPTGRILFTAKVNKRSSIFSMAPGSRPSLFSSPDEEVDSPAVSPDERFVAFRKLVHSRWKLAYMDVATRQEEMLTFGDCNAYSPMWMSSRTIAYATDCGRGFGLSALASVDIGQAQDSSGRP